MPAPQALAFFGLEHPLIAASFTLSHGISPSTATLTVPPFKGPAPMSGPLVFRYDNRQVVFGDCRLDKIERSVTGDGKEVWQLIVLDRRWLWRETGKISGFYNTRRGEQLDVKTEKTPRELATLCLDAMGERRYDLSRMPNSTRPEVDWDYENPAEALARLCDAAGCRVVLGIDDRVYLIPVGFGRPLPNGPILEGGLQLDPPDVPGKVVIVTARTRHQVDAPLEAVGVEIDGSIKPIGELSYTPTVAGKRTWEYSDVEHFQEIKDKRLRGLAQRSVFRWYRVRVPLFVPGAGKISTLARILPLLSTQVEYLLTSDNRIEPRPAWVYGSWWAGYESPEPEVDTFKPHVLNEPKGLYTRGFSVDVETAIVQFNEPVLTLVPDRNVLGRRVFPASIALRVAVGIRDDKTRAWNRVEFEQQIKTKSASKKRSATSKTRSHYVLKDDVIPWIYVDYDAGGVTRDNRAEVKRQSQYYLDAELAAYQWQEGGSITYAGWLFHPLDGAIQQITWDVSSDGKATTRVSRNNEELVVTPSYKERRLIEKLQDALERREKPERQRLEDARAKKG